jgi:hypothetical protein
MNTVPMLAPDAAMVLGIAATAIPFARTPEEQAERWLRVLRLHGEVGVALQALGVSEESLRVPAGSAAREPTASTGDATTTGDAATGAVAGADAKDRDVIALVTEQAARISLMRGAPGLGTVDVLMAVMHVYGAVFQRALRAHGTDAREVLQRLDAELPEPHDA